MQVTDPAIEATRRARHYRADYSWDDKVCGIAAAREALKPIRELHRPVKQYAHPDSGLDCLECGKAWPCSTALRIYSTEELESE